MTLRIARNIERVNILEKAVYHFPLDGAPEKCETIKSGHINNTYLITTDTGAKYILQRINQYVFPKVDAIMRNMSSISEHLRRQGGEMAMISYINTVDGKSYYSDDKGGVWRIYRFVENSICLQKADTPEDFYESARAFGKFQYALNSFPAGELEETIDNFHNTPDRYRLLEEAIAEDSVGRAAGVKAEIEFALARRERSCRLHKMREDGSLPVRVTHNDTKINNVLFDADTRKAICVIDLDTVMPGLSAYDFGDAIRFGASTAAEDEKELSRVSVDMELYRTFAKGFMDACPSLTDAEIDALPLGAYTMTIECGIRFLTDYIKGDKYFGIDYPEQNLDRCHTQFRLIEDMENKWDEMERIVAELK